MRHVDVAIIGGSLAGAACVRELQRSGIDAVAFERDRFPREKVCGGFLSPGAVDLLDQLGILETVRAAGAKRVRSTRIRMQHLETCVALPRPGLGISRRALDSLLADHPGVQHGTVRDVQRKGESFSVQLDDERITARVVIDAAGKLSRFTPRRTTPQFGVQYYESESREDILDFWFFEDGYGGAVSVEGNRSNACFLIYKDKVRDASQKASDRPSWPGGVAARSSKDREASLSRADGVVDPEKLRLIHHPGASRHPSWPGGAIARDREVLVTGPLSYERLPSNFLSIGDASGMVDPFCGEGMRHALDTGMCSAKVVAEGLRHRDSYDTIRARYELETRKRWRTKRRLGRFFRTMLRRPRLSAAGFRLNPEYWLRKLWD